MQVVHDAFDALKDRQEKAYEGSDGGAPLEPRNIATAAGDVGDCVAQSEKCE